MQKAFILFLVLASCKSSVITSVKNGCSQSGFFSPDTKISVEDVHIDSMQYSNGRYLYSLNGVCYAGAQINSFRMILSSNSVGCENVLLLNAHFPFAQMDTTSMNANIQSCEDRIIVEWEKDTSYLKLSIELDAIEGY